MKKHQIVEYLQQRLDKKISELKSSVETLTEARNNEDKCTVGDKYETGRAMAQMELEKSQALLTQTENMKTALSRIDLQRKIKSVEFGSLVQTNRGNYFFAIPYGKIEVDGETIFCLSPVSPVAKALAGEKTGDSTLFQGQEIQIGKIS